MACNNLLIHLSVIQYFLQMLYLFMNFYFIQLQSPGMVGLRLSKMQHFVAVHCLQYLSHFLTVSALQMKQIINSVLQSS